MTEQFSFISARWPSAKPAKRSLILAVLDEVIPWPELESSTRHIYQADSRRTGRKGHSLRMMLRCWVLACVWRLSDDSLVEFILDSLAAAKFIGCDPWSPRPPSASTFRNFRRLIASRTQCEGWIRHKIDLAMIDACLQWRQGAVVEPQFRRMDRRTISAPPAKRKGERA